MHFLFTGPKLAIEIGPICKHRIRASCVYGCMYIIQETNHHQRQTKTVWRQIRTRFGIGSMHVFAIRFFLRGQLDSRSVGYWVLGCLAAETGDYISGFCLRINQYLQIGKIIGQCICFSSNQIQRKQTQSNYTVSCNAATEQFFSFFIFTHH